MKMRILITMFLGVLIAFTACEDDGQLNESKLSLGFQAVESPGMLKATDTLVFDSAMVGIKEIEIEREDEADDDSFETDDDGEIEYEFEGPYQVNLLAGTRISDLAEVEPGLYTELEAELAPVLANNHSVYIQAQYTNSTGESRQVIFSTDESIEFEIENDQGILVNDQEIKDLIVRIDLTGLFNSIDLDAARVDDAGRILINEDHNSSLAEKLENYLETVAEMEEDDDDDDDDDEDDDDEDDDDDDEDDDEGDDDEDDK